MCVDDATSQTTRKCLPEVPTIVLLLLGYAVGTLFAVYTFLFFTFASIFDDIMISLGHYWSTYSAFYSAAFSSTPAINADSRRTEE